MPGKRQLKGRRASARVRSMRGPRSSLAHDRSHACLCRGRHKPSGLHANDKRGAQHNWSTTPRRPTQQGAGLLPALQVRVPHHRCHAATGLGPSSPTPSSQGAVHSLVSLLMRLTKGLLLRLLLMYSAAGSPSSRTAKSLLLRVSTLLEQRY